MNDIKTYTLTDILNNLDEEYELVGKPLSPFFDKIMPPAEADQSSLVFISDRNINAQTMAEQTKASYIICHPATKITDEMSFTKCFILVNRPTEAFVRVGNVLFQKSVKWGIHPTAIVRPGATVHPCTSIGPFSYIGNGTTIKHGTIIHSHCFFYDNTPISIGNKCNIQSGCTIGTDGFGYVLMRDGKYENFPQVGGVVIGDEVHIHAHVNIDRGTLGNTIISGYTKIDKYCHIGHNVQIGKSCIICARTLIAGSAHIGDGVWIAPSVTIRDGGLEIGSNAFIGIGSLVVKNVPADSRVMGSPARTIDDYKLILEAEKKALKEQ